LAGAALMAAERGLLYIKACAGLPGADWVKLKVLWKRWPFCGFGCCKGWTGT